MRCESIQSSNTINLGLRSSSGLRVVIMAVFPRIKLRENLWNRWEVAIDSFCPVCLARAASGLGNLTSKSWRQKVCKFATK